MSEKSYPHGIINIFRPAQAAVRPEFLRAFLFLKKTRMRHLTISRMKTTSSRPRKKLANEAVNPAQENSATGRLISKFWYHGKLMKDLVEKSCSTKAKG